MELAAVDECPSHGHLVLESPLGSNNLQPFSLSDAMTDNQPIHISIASSLIQFQVPLSTFLHTNPSYTNLAVGACIFTDTEPKRLLLLQRAATEMGFPNRKYVVPNINFMSDSTQVWEVPGGSIDGSDPTLIHGLAREIFEETGLKLTRVSKSSKPLFPFRDSNMSYETSLNT